jgi:hypothetical protein
MIYGVKPSMLYQEVKLLLCIPGILVSDRDRKKTILNLGFLMNYISQYFQITEQ